MPPTPERPFDLVVFDWDGTLMDSLGAIVACTRATLAALELAPLADDEIRRAVGLGIDETVERLAPGAGHPEAEALKRCYRDLWVSTYRDRPVLFADAEPLLGELERTGYLLAVATGKSRRGLDRDLEATGLARRFQATRTVDEAPSKPHPGMLLSLLDELGVGPHRALMIGDSAWDLQMAGNAGVPAVGITTGGYPRGQLLEHGPAGCVECLEELVGWLAAHAAGER
ncbi:MAG TPA: HAD-IA family hydrolase [Thermoanaerobaculia bacterium]|nr:HAD-IA family hydrolase [Thermoanaerobaculia bacterium]